MRVGRSRLRIRRVVWRATRCRERLLCGTRRRDHCAGRDGRGSGQRCDRPCAKANSRRRSPPSPTTAPTNKLQNALQQAARVIRAGSREPGKNDERPAVQASRTGCELVPSVKVLPEGLEQGRNLRGKAAKTKSRGIKSGNMSSDGVGRVAVGEGGRGSRSEGQRCSAGDSLRRRSKVEEQRRPNEAEELTGEVGMQGLDADLAAVVEAWAGLPPAIKAAVGALIHAVARQSSRVPSEAGKIASTSARIQWQA